ncbi:MAG TPA: signal peptidase II [Streptosporangiaceae bacterium]
MAARTIGPGRYAAVAFLIGFAVCVLDLVSKVLVVADLPPPRTVVLLGGLITLQQHRNPGAAFSIGPSDTVIFALVAAGVLVVILRLARRLRSWPWTVALGLLLGGATGNLIDRLFRAPGPLRGSVVDWIKLPYFPATFNLADSAIVTGAALLVLASICGWQLAGTRAGVPEPPATHG